MLSLYKVSLASHYHSTHIMRVVIDGSTTALTCQWYTNQEDQSNVSPSRNSLRTASTAPSINQCSSEVGKAQTSSIYERKGPFRRDFLVPEPRLDEQQKQHDEQLDGQEQKQKDRQQKRLRKQIQLHRRTPEIGVRTRIEFRITFSLVKAHMTFPSNIPVPLLEKIPIMPKPT